MSWNFIRLLAAFVAIHLISISVGRLEDYRAGVEIRPLSIGSTPATVYKKGTVVEAPAAVIAHGFAGSQQLMQAFALTLAHAGYVAITFDFEGHGRNPTPISGDVTKTSGTTRLLMEEVGRVTDFALALPSVNRQVALLGHSMASDIIVRQAIGDKRVAAVVAVSMFSEAVTADQPPNLLMIMGAWETLLRRQALRTLHLSDPTASEGQTLGSIANGTGRLAVAAPAVEHVGVLYSETALDKARKWLDAVFERRSQTTVAATGGWIILLLAGIVLLAWPLSSLLPKSGSTPSHLRLPVFIAASLVPAALTPIVLYLFDTRFLPVLVADYLAVHLFVYGSLSIAILRLHGIKFGPTAWHTAMLLAIFGIFVFGGAIDRYVASFYPAAGRLLIIFAVAVGAVIYMTADSLLSEAGRAPWLRIFIARAAFLTSLVGAIALAPERLFFLLIILPVIVLFFLIFGLLGGWAGRQTSSPLAVGIGLGLILAWAIGVSFPLFISS